MNPVDETQPDAPATVACPYCGQATRPGRFCSTCGLALPAPGAAAPRPPAPPRRWRVVLAWSIVALMLVCVVLLVILSVGSVTALALGTVAAVVPAVVYGLIVLRLDRYEPEPPRMLVAAFGWGAVGAILLSVLAGIVAQPLLRTEEASAVIGAPFIEETFKGLALLVMLALLRREIDNTLDGLIYGALMGLGFAMTENILYFGSAYVEDGLVGLGVLFIARAVIGGWGHAVYTGVTGAAVGWARGRYRRGILRFVVPILGWMLAVALHAAWNGGLVLVISGLGDDANLFVAVGILALLVVLPGLVLLGIVARISHRKQLQVMREQLAPEVRAGVLSPAEYAEITDDALRRASLRQAARVGGKDLVRRQRRFFETAAELAFRKHHIANGEPLAPGQRAPDAVYREELAALRAQLPQPPTARPA